MGGRQAGAARPSASGGQRSAGRARRGALWQRERVVAADAGLAGLRRRIAIQPPGAWRRRCPHGKPDLPSMRPRPARARHPAGACLGARWRRAWIGLGLLACLTMPASDARAAPPAERLAVVIGEAAYSRLPAEPACSLSAQVIASRLRGRGFAVATRNDATKGEIGAMLIALARQAAAGHPSVVIYFCGHAVEFDGRSFLLPIDAVLGRHSDVLAEGIPAQSLLDIANRGTHVGLTVLDLYMQPQSQPNAPAALPPLAAGRVLSPGHIVMAASESAAAATATPLAQSLSAALTKPPGDLDAISAAIRGDLAGSGVALAVFGKGGGAQTPPAAAGRSIDKSGTACGQHAGGGAIFGAGSPAGAGRAASARLLCGCGGRHIRTADPRCDPALSARCRRAADRNADPAAGCPPPRRAAADRPVGAAGGIAGGRHGTESQVQPRHACRLPGRPRPCGVLGLCDRAAGRARGGPAAGPHPDRCGFGGARLYRQGGRPPAGGAEQRALPAANHSVLRRAGGVAQTAAALSRLRLQGGGA